MGILLEVHDSKKKTILTRGGILEYKRKILVPKDKSSLQKLCCLESKKTVVPLDIYLGIDSLPFKMTPRLMLDVAHLSIQLRSYKQAEKICQEKLNLDISDDIIRDVTDFIGLLVYKYDWRIANNVIKDTKHKFDDDEKKEYLLIEMDGSFIHIRSDDGKSLKWREVKTALVASSKNFKRIMNKEGEYEIRLGEREYTCFLGSVHEFKKYLLALCKKHNYELYNKIVIITDGASWIKSIKNEYFPKGIQILDFFHLSENTFNFLKYIYKDNLQLAQNLWKEWCEFYKNSQVEKVLALTEKYKGKKFGDGIVNLYEYLLSNIDIVDYKSFIANGFFIGSGSIESANKWVVQGRIKNPGMSWKEQSSQHLLSLLAKYYSNLWNSVEAIVLDQFDGRKI